MRTLSDTLLKAQKSSSLSPAIKITLTGATTLVLEEDRIRKLNHIEDPYRINAKETEFDNSDGYFTDLDLQGFKAVISYGLATKAGKEYSDTSPMWVTWQQLESVPGRLSCLLTMLGIPDLMDEDEASASYMPEETDTKSVKALINEIAGTTGVTMLACFSHCQKFDVVWESGYDTLADTYIPKDSFRVYIGSSRLVAIKRLLEHTGNVLRFPADGKIHILKPVTEGTTYDYEYSLENGHPFLGKAYRKTLIIPNYIVVSSQPDDDPQITPGVAIDTESYNLLPKRKYYQTRLASPAEATSIAQAILSRYQLNAERGSAEALMNCGAELFDYIKVTDEREGDSRVGSIGYISRKYNAEKRIYTLTFGLGDPPILQHIRELYQSIKKVAQEEDDADFERLYAKHAYIEDLWIDQIRAIWLDENNTIDPTKLPPDWYDKLPDGELYAKVTYFNLGLDEDPNSPTYMKYVVKLDEHTLYKAGYDPTDKFDLGLNNLDNVLEGLVYRRTRGSALTAAGLVILDNCYVDWATGQYALIARTDISAGHLYLSSVIQSAFYRTVSDAEKGIYLAKTNTFRQTTAPTTGMKAGDIWVDTDDGDKPYTYSVTLGWVAAYTQISGGCITTGIINCSLVNIKSATSGERVEITAAGVTIIGGKLTLKSSAGTYSAQLYIDTSGYLRIDNWAITVAQSIVPSIDGSWTVGATNRRYHSMYARYFFPMTTGGFIFNTEAAAVEGSIKIKGAGSGDIYVYSNYAWRINT